MPYKLKPEPVKRKILKVIKKEPIGLSIREIAKRVKIAPSTASKFCLILEAEKKLEIVDFGNLKLVRKK